MAAGDMVSIRGQVMEYMYIPTGIKREKVRSGEDCDWKEVSHQDCWKRTGVHFNFWLVLLTS
jgi:hypothetical protein